MQAGETFTEQDRQRYKWLNEQIGREMRRGKPDSGALNRCAKALVEVKERGYYEIEGAGGFMEWSARVHGMTAHQAKKHRLARIVASNVGPPHVAAIGWVSPAPGRGRRPPRCTDSLPARSPVEPALHEAPSGAHAGDVTSVSRSVLPAVVTCTSTRRT